ncbi:type VII secretion protein EccCa [Protaetiibacter intestinalis]|uniref:Type VII secretion protein EccCa n=1 Tax=Protaetiibacter intestinalis TaxID=2419774 RepID=A0A387B7I2_9MICO|nr:type VII secretion protein EccCa [Protaetiibacter intestinalis]AYF97751.1 type VII secretion protein EccCa [Protaetiibacter intestinalis]
MAGNRLAPPRLPSGKVQVQPPPTIQPADGGGLIQTLLPALGSLGAIIMVVTTNAGPTGLLTGGMFLISSLGFVGVNGWRQRSQRNAQILTARRDYLRYISELRETVRVAGRQQRRHTNWMNPAPDTLTYLAEDRTRVWERSPSDADFLSVRLGTSDQPLCIQLEAPPLPDLTQLDPVAASSAHRFMLAHEVERELPLAYGLRSYSRVELLGDEEHVRAMARAMISSIATLHHPEAVQLVVVSEPATLDRWEWVKWLPHAHSRVASDAIGPARLIGSEWAELLGMLPADLRERPRFAADSAPLLPHLVVVTDGARIPPGDPILGPDGMVGVTVIDLPATWGELESPQVLRVLAEEGEVLTTTSRVTQVAFDTLSVAEAEATARRLMPLYAGPASGAPGQAAATTTQLELVDLLGLPDVRDIDFSLAWQPRLERDRLRVPIGQSPDGGPVVLDIKEAAQQGMGPHGLIIGATGSGKSEVLRTMVLALALTHSPEQLNFVLVDFKGGATFAGMSEMPHVSAIITNLGEELTLVDRMQDALQGEVTRRQELLRAAGNFANVSDYEKARRGGRTDLAPLPALLIVADEFSEMLTAKPEFADTFVMIGRVGRSLQVHLLLSSQRLEEGKLRGLDTHLSYRIGLRTFSAAESRTVLGVPDAFTLPSIPGVGYLKFTTDSMTQFRAAYVSAPPPRRKRQAAAAGGATAASAEIELFRAAPVIRTVEEEDSAPVPTAGPAEPEEKRNTFEIAVERMSGLGPMAHRVWLPPLEVPPSLDELMPDLAEDPQLGLVSPRWRAVGNLTIPLGITDIPLEQRRESFAISLGGAGGHMAIVGAPLSGKSTLARTVVVSLALTMTPREVQFYIADFGGGTFAGLTGFPHIAGVATRSEPDVVRRMISEITGIVDAREQYFRVNNIDSIDTYRMRRAEGRVDDGYGDVFLVVDGWATLRAEFEAYEPAIQALAARGLTYGIHVVITAARWMEIRASLKDLIGTRVELRLGDASDSEVDRKVAAAVPTRPGRGLDPRRLHMITALPRVDGSGDPTTLANGVEELVARANAAWTGTPGPKLRLLPELITLDEVRAAAPATEAKTAWLGVDEASIAPFGLDLHAEPHLYLYGDADSGKSSMLRGFVSEIVRQYGPKEAKIFVVDYRRSLLGEIPETHLGAYLTSHEQATGGMAELAAFFQSRMPGPEVTAEQLRTRSWWTGAEGFVLVDDYDLVSTSQGNPVAALAPLLAQAADVGLHLIVTRRTGGASRAAYDAVIQRFTDLGVTGILLSGNPEEGQLIGKVKPQLANPGRAQIVSRDRGVFAGQLAYSPPTQE